MKQSGISLQVHYIPIHFQPYYQKNYGFKVGDFPASERFYANELSLPIYPTLDENDINNVISNTIKFLNL